MGLCLLLLVSLLLAGFVSNELLHSWPSLALNSLSPPPGNSLLLKVKTRNGTRKYGCYQKKWKLLSADAELVDVLNSAKAGLYHYSHHNRSAGSWALSNSREEFAESGHRLSEVSGIVVASEETGEEGCANILAEAIEHRYSGRASLVSYIQALSTKVKVPEAENCSRVEASNTWKQVSFETEYWMWYQDRSPPVDTPAEVLAPRDGKLVEGFFAKGIAYYVFNGGKWVERDWNAKLYDVPGGDFVGHHFMRNSSELVWEFFNPNGFGVNGTLSKRRIAQVAENCMPWSLFVVTSSWGNLSHVQMVSTRGGVSPPLPSDSSSSSPVEPSRRLPAAGEIYNSTFSSVFWFYSSS